MSRKIEDWFESGEPGIRLVAGANAILNQVNKRWPERSKKNDGWIGGEIHHNVDSDHNPNEEGFVHAIDIDTNLMGESEKKKSKEDADKFADELIEYVRKAVPGSERIKYVIYDNKIASGTFATRYWVWREGEWGCKDHIHISFTKTGQSDPRNVSLPIFSSRPKVVSNLAPAKAPKYPGKERLMFGKSNESVRRLKNQMLAKGFELSGESDTIYNEETKAAVKSLYHKIGKKSDGSFVGPVAWTFLFRS
jgi:hypothetical protein